MPVKVMSQVLPSPLGLEVGGGDGAAGGAARVQGQRAGEA